jgi:hypothetical protein
MTTKIAAEPEMPDEGVTAFLELANSANFFFDVVRGRLTVRAVNPNWSMWKPIRHFLDEIGQARIEAYFRRT